MASLLHKCTGITEDEMGDTQHALGSVLRLSRALARQHPEQSRLPERIAQYVVSRLGLIAIQAKFSAAISSSSAWPYFAPTEFGTAIEDNKKVVDDRMEDCSFRRVLAKVLAQRCSVFVRLTSEILSRQNQHSLPLTNTIQNDVETSDILFALFGKGSSDLHFAKRGTQAEEEADILHVQKREVMRLRQAVEGCNAERKAIALRIAELRQSIEKLELHDAELCAKIVDIEGDIESFIASGVEGAFPSVPLETNHYGDKVNALVGMLEKYDESLDRALAVSTTAILSVEVVSRDFDNIASSVLDIFISCMHNYFEACVKCVDLLQERIQSSRENTRRLVRISSQNRLIA